MKFFVGSSFFWLAIVRGMLAAPVDFVRDVRPIFESHCYECHAEKKQKSGLRLDVKAAALKGGDEHGAILVAGQSGKSQLIRMVTSDESDERMPPKGEGLSADEIAILKAWIDQGAVWPDGADLVRITDKRDHWSFKPLTGSDGFQPSPSNSVMAGSHHSLDAFITAKLEENGLTMSPPADRITWLRRVTFDLIGLPPAPEQVASFVSDTRPDAFERVVDALLASPRHGERWAQHWLDVVRYADTHGFEVNTERPNAWPYRDYVIDALNQDTPYDRFIREQIAGDVLGKDAATGFLVTASVLLRGQIGKDEPSKRLARQDSLDEIVVNIGQTFLGLSVGCARCHDHKFDPILQHDYYAMQALVAGVEYEDRLLRTPEAQAARKEATRCKSRIVQIDQELAHFVPLAKSGADRPPVNARENTDRFRPVKSKRLRFTIAETNKLEPCIDELEVFNTAGENIALASAGATVTSSGDIIVADRHELRHINDGLYGNPRSWLSNEKGRGWVILEFPEEQTIERVTWGRDRDGKYTDRLATHYAIEVADADGKWRVVADSEDRRKFDPNDKTPVAFSVRGLSKKEAKEAQPLMEERARLDARRKAAESTQKVFGGVFRKPDEIHLLSRGDPEQPKEEVIPAVLTLLGNAKIDQATDEPARRVALAEWIASPQNPLTARVMVNRIWQGHFGTGLVETASDFGHNGTKPSHPELLDWLAGEFIRSGWSIKHMHRIIVLSEAYRQSSEVVRPGSARAKAQQADFEARLLWRFPARRLEAETIRDSILAVSGRLNLTMYGRGFNFFVQRGGLTGFRPIEIFKEDGLKRMIYAHKVRREREAVFGAFDCPDAGQSTARRRETTTALQALNLFNSRFTLDQSEALAQRVMRDAGDDVTSQIRSAYQYALNRDPTSDELHDAASTVREHGLAVLCRALFNCNEFLFLP